jgi:hypothetical protein
MSGNVAGNPRQFNWFSVTPRTLRLAGSRPTAGACAITTGCSAIGESDESVDRPDTAMMTMSGTPGTAFEPLARDPLSVSGT